MVSHYNATQGLIQAGNALKQSANSIDDVVRGRSQEVIKNFKTTVKEDYPTIHYPVGLSENNIDYEDMRMMCLKKASKEKK